MRPITTHNASSQKPVAVDDSPIRIADRAKHASPAIATRLEGKRSASLPACSNTMASTAPPGSSIRPAS